MSRLVSIPDYSRESFPYLFYKKIGIIYGRTDITFPLDFGFNYMVERIAARWSSENVNLPGDFAAPLQIELFKDGSATACQKVPFDISLMSSPAESGVDIDLTSAGKSFTARELDRCKALNLLHFYRDIIHLVVSNVTKITIPGDPSGSLPAYVEFMIKGRYFPYLKQEAWQK